MSGIAFVQQPHCLKTRAHGLTSGAQNTQTGIVHHGPIGLLSFLWRSIDSRCQIMFALSIHAAEMASGNGRFAIFSVKRLRFAKQIMPTGKFHFLAPRILCSLKPFRMFDSWHGSNIQKGFRKNDAIVPVFFGMWRLSVIADNTAKKTTNVYACQRCLCLLLLRVFKPEFPSWWESLSVGVECAFQIRWFSSYFCKKVWGVVFINAVKFIRI
jgi:hypothetical protein